MYFKYGESELEYLRNKDKKLAEVIDKVGHIYRKTDANIFSSVVHHIIGQQISTKAQATIWERMQNELDEVNAEQILSAGMPKLQSFGMTFRKAEYISDFAEKVTNGDFDLDEIQNKSDKEGKLLSMNVWTDEAAVERWRNVVEHRISQKEGREKLFESYKITVCSAIRSYTDTDRENAPADSNRFFEV